MRLFTSSHSTNCRLWRVTDCSFRSEPLPVAGWERLEKELSVSGAPITGPHRMIPVSYTHLRTFKMFRTLLFRQASLLAEDIPEYGMASVILLFRDFQTMSFCIPITDIFRHLPDKIKSLPGQ